MSLLNIKVIMVLFVSSIAKADALIHISCVAFFHKLQILLHFRP